MNFLAWDLLCHFYLYTLHGLTAFLWLCFFRLLQWTRSRWALTRCTTRARRPTARCTAGASPTDSVRNSSRRPLLTSAPSRRSGSLRTRATPSSGTWTSWCCYITVDPATTALQNGACTYQWISKQMHYKTPLFTQQLHEKSGILLKQLHSVLSGKKNFLAILYYLKNMHGILPKMVEITIVYATIKEQHHSVTIILYFLKTMHDILPKVVEITFV